MRIIRRDNNGFTIVELIIVIVVTAILATIVVVAYRGIQQSARESRVASQLASVRKAMESERIVNGKWPFEDAARTRIANGEAPVMAICNELNAYLNSKKVLSGQNSGIEGSDAGHGANSCMGTNLSGQTITGIRPNGNLIFCAAIAVSSEGRSSSVVISSERIGILKYTSDTNAFFAFCAPGA